MSAMDQGKDRPSKKIVINNLRKSIMAGGGLNSEFVQPGMISESLSLNNNQQPNPALNSNASNPNKELGKVTEQLAYYREKHDQSLIKVRFLTEKLESYGGLNSIPDTLVNEISETDLKIKNLE